MIKSWLIVGLLLLLQFKGDHRETLSRLVPCYQFNLNVADLPAIAQENVHHYASFADDMSVQVTTAMAWACRCKDASSAVDMLCQAIQDIGLEIHAEKTTSMIISIHLN